MSNKPPYEGCGVLENRKFRPFRPGEEKQLEIGYVPGIEDETPQALYGKPRSSLRVMFTKEKPGDK